VSAVALIKEHKEHHDVHALPLPCGSFLITDAQVMEFFPYKKDNMTMEFMMCMHINMG
jgi:hypothetical protein